MASPAGSPRRGHTLIIDGIPYDTHPSEVLERLQASAGRLQRACTTTRSPSMVHSLAAQQRQRQQQQQQRLQASSNESASIPGYPSQHRVYSVKTQFSTREAASKARDLLLAAAQPHFQFAFSDVEIHPNFVLEEEDTLLDIPIIISQASLHATTGCGVCGTSSNPRSAEETPGRRTSAEGIDPTRKQSFDFLFLGLG